MWTVKHIMEADFGCEERAENEPPMVLVTLEADDGRMMQFEAEDKWLIEQGINEGDEWPDAVDAIEAEADKPQFKWWNLKIHITINHGLIA